jgi:hypothetical protein
MGSLDEVFSYGLAQQYTVLAVDGSQVYPNRHMAGIGCFLLNVGGAQFTYGEAASTVSFFSIPEVCPFSEMNAGKESVPSEVVDLLRESRER